ncbi:MAG: hypothetical protein Q9159_000594 [Coniocarpon cinnabarinum]
MMNYLRGTHTPHEATPHKNEVSEPSVKEVNPSPEAEKENPITYPRQRVSPYSTPKSDASTITTERAVRTLGPVNRRSLGSRTLSGRYVTSYLKEQHVVVRDRSRARLGAGLSSYVFDTSYSGLLEWIKAERLTRLPHKGSAWDRVLSGAHFFAEQVNSLHEKTQAFNADTNIAANFVFGQCQLLLELGHENASALRKVFRLFYMFGIELHTILKRAELFALDISIQEGIGNAFADLLTIVSSVAVQFHLAVHGAQASVALDIYATFGTQIENFRRQVAEVAENMWTAALEKYGLGDSFSVDHLRAWLAPSDSVLKFLSSTHVNLANQPADYTCVWFQSHLLNFLRSNNKVLLVEGEAGSGKSTLAQWVSDRLQRPIGRKNVATLSFAFNQTIPGQSTALAMVRTLLYQLLEQRIGDIALYEAIEHAYNELESSHDARKHEEILWTSLSKALHAMNEEGNAETLAILVDGLDECQGQKMAAPAISKRLQELAQKYASVKLIQFSRPLEMQMSSNATLLTLTEEHTNEDSRTLLKQSLHHHQAFRERTDVDQDKIIERLMAAADGSLLWAGLASQYLRLQATSAGLLQAIEALESAKSKVSEVVQKILTVIQLNSRSKGLISWLCAAERPLTFAELRLLANANTDKRMFVESSVDVQGLLRSVRPFVVVGEGLVAMRHLAIKHALINVPSTSKNSLQLTNRHWALLERLMIYTKSCTNDEHDVTFSSWERGVVSKRFHSHQLLEYAVRYWAEHLQKIPSYKKSELSSFAIFKDIFPSSTTFAILERSCWSSHAFFGDICELYSVGLKIRQTLFGRTHASVLQAMISYASISEALSMTAEAIKYSAQVCQLSRDLYGVQANLVVHCSNWMLQLSETSVTKTRTEIMTYREQTYRLLIECYKHSYGEHSVQVLEIYRKLAELYMLISEEHKATEIYKIIHVITISIYGGESEEAKSLSGHLGVVLHKHEHKDVEHYEESLFGGFLVEFREEFTIVIVERILIKASELCIRGEFVAAEELYVELWLRLTEKCRITEVVEWHEKKILLMLTYARFLEARRRLAEASSLLLCIWREYEFHAFSTVESIILHFKEIAILMKKVSLLQVALSVFKKCWSYFKSTHRTETTIYREIEEHITVTSKAIVEVAVKNVTTSTSETVIREVFESSIEESSTTEISSTTIELCESLTSIYMKEERFSEAITCIKSVVKRSWSSFFAASFQSTTTIHMASLDLVTQLAICYLKQSRLEKAESVYVRLYRAVRSCYSVDHQLVIKYSEMLLSFYKQHSLYSKAISFYQSLLVEYRAFYGISHSIVVRTLYALGDLCRQHYRTHGYWIDYYLEIVTSLNKGAAICHVDALRALVIVAECYFEDCRYSESLAYYKVIASTFFKHGISYEYFKQVTEITKIFEHYEHAMIESKVEISVIISMLKEYHESCVRHFGATAEITITATMQYASMCMKSEHHHMQHSSRTEITTRCKTTLRTLYVKQVTSRSSTTVTKTMLESATTLTYERYLEVRKTYSCSHETSIKCLSELIQLYYQQSKYELAIKELRSYIMKCVTEVTSSKELIAVAVSVASIFRSCEYIDYAYELIRELKMQIIFKSTLNVSKYGFNLTASSRVAFAFLAAFEAHMLQTVSVAELMAEYSAMFLYYERYSSAIKSKSSVMAIFVSAAKLRHLINKRQRIEYYFVIEREVYTYFSSSETRVIKDAGSESAVKLFITLLLEHLVERTVTEASFVAIAGRAATARIQLLLEAKKFKDALDLTKCTYAYLMAHEGLDDETEISQGFTLCLMMAGRGYPRCGDAQLAKAMMDFSRQILKQVFEIIRTCHIEVARCKLEDLSELMGLLGEQQDWANLQYVLSSLWKSREGQKWSQNTTTSIARRLIQAYFCSGNYASAMRLAEDMLYNVRCVYGPRSANALSFYELVSQLYISSALQLQQQDTKTAKETAQAYFKKAADVHTNVLKLFVNVSEDSAGEDSDLDSEISSNASSPKAGCGHTYLEQKKEREEAMKRHMRGLKLAYQRLGGWTRDAKDFDKVTDLVWQAHGKDLGMERKNVMSREWSSNGWGAGKSEGREDEFVGPSRWEVL